MSHIKKAVKHIQDISPGTHGFTSRQSEPFPATLSALQLNCNTQNNQTTKQPV